MKSVDSSHYVLPDMKCIDSLGLGLSDTASTNIRDYDVVHGLRAAPSQNIPSFMKCIDSSRYGLSDMKCIDSLGCGLPIIM